MYKKEEIETKVHGMIISISILNKKRIFWYLDVLNLNTGTQDTVQNKPNFRSGNTHWLNE